MVLTTALSAVWLLAGAGKLAVPRIATSFLASVVNRPVTTATVRAFAVLELALAMGLAVPAVRSWAAPASGLASAGLLLVLVRARSLRSGRLPCGCFGPLVPDQRIGVGHFILVAAMLLASALVLGHPAGDRYIGLDAQLLALGTVMILVCARFLRLRRAV